MSLFITKIGNANTSVTYNYLDTEHVWGAIVSSNYEFSVLDVNFLDETDELVYGIEALEKAYARQNIAAKIGVDEFKNGLVKSISFPDSNRVGSTTASITIEERLSVENDGILSLLADNIASPQDVESFTEDFSFSRGENSYSYSRNVDLKYAQDAGGFFLQKAYLFLRNIYLGSRPSYGFQEDGISEFGKTDSTLKPDISVVINQIDKTVSLSENLETARIFFEGGINYSKLQTHALAIDENGYSSKVYSTSVKALNEPLEINVNSGLHLSLNSILAENTGIYGKPFIIEKTLNSDGGNAEMSVHFSNDPRLNSATNATYTASKRASDSFDLYSFDISVKSVGYDKYAAFQNSRQYLLNNQSAPYIKIPRLFPEISSGALNEVSRRVSFKPFERTADSSFEFTTDPAYADSGDGILSRKIQVSDVNSIARDFIVPVYGNSELIIKNSAKTLGQRTVSVEISSIDINQAEATAIELATGEFPNHNYYYLSSKSSSIMPLENKAESNVSFFFFD